jgi:enoyl-CoA hydratase/carnithine racemase
MAREMALTGRDVAAEEALRIGLVNRVLPDADACWQLHWSLQPDGQQITAGGAWQQGNAELRA